MSENYTGVIQKIICARPEIHIFVFNCGHAEGPIKVSTTQNIALTRGDHLHIIGSWYEHPRYGKQLKGIKIEKLQPPSIQEEKAFTSSTESTICAEENNTPKGFSLHQSQKSRSNKKEEENLRQLYGRIKKIICEKPGFCILRIIENSSNLEYIVKGRTAFRLSLDDSIQAKGIWITHEKYGRQFDAKIIQKMSPSSVFSSSSSSSSFLLDTTSGGGGKLLSTSVLNLVPEEEKAFLSYMLGEIDEATYDKIVSEIRAKIEEASKDQTSSLSLGALQRTEDVIMSYSKRVGLLISYGLSPESARLVADHYEEDMLNKLKQNPYQLYSCIPNFEELDLFGKNMGVTSGDSRRLVCCIDLILKKRLKSGHYCTEMHVLFEKLRDQYYPALSEELMDQVTLLAQNNGLIYIYKNLIYIRQLYNIETNIIHHLLKILNAREPQIVPSCSKRSSRQTTLFRPVKKRKTERRGKGEIKKSEEAIERDNDVIFISDEDEDEDEPQSLLSSFRSKSPHFCDFEVEENENNLLMLRLTQEQQKALKMVCDHRISFITGFPGSGKTTMCAEVVKTFLDHEMIVLIGCPTGTAAKCLNISLEKYFGDLRTPSGFSFETSQETDVFRGGIPKAMTIHRLILFLRNEYFQNFESTESGVIEDSPEPSSPQSKKRKRRGEKRKKLKIDAVILDETSMLDLETANDLFNTLSMVTTTDKPFKLVFIGDPNQLPPVGPGQLFRDLIASEIFPVARLKTILRQERGSEVIVVAQKILEGFLGTLPQDLEKEVSFFPCSKESDPESILKDRIFPYLSTKGYGQMDVHVVSPVKKHKFGVFRLNAILQQLLNPEEGEPALKFPDFYQRYYYKKRSHSGSAIKTRKGIVYRAGDQVVYIKNDYSKQLFNGDTGIVLEVCEETETGDEKDEENEHAGLEELTLKIDFGLSRGPVTLKKKDLSNVMHAWANTIHRSQGHEYAVIIIFCVGLPGVEQVFDRCCFYTAVTRARKVIILGEPDVIDHAIKFSLQKERISCLAERLREELCKI